MYIEFVATTDLYPYSNIMNMVQHEIEDWAMINEIPYTSKRHKNTFRIAFNDDKHYTVFRLTWQNLPLTEYRIIDNKW